MRLKRCLGSLALVALLAGSAAGHTHHGRHGRHHAQHTGPPVQPYSWEGTQVDLSPIVVEPYALPDATDAAHASFLRRMNLENGVKVDDTRRIRPSDVRSRDLFVLDITQSLEGGFDSVNVYDKGILSWGIMQWAARYGSLNQSLIFIKRRLWAQKRKSVWDKTFVANGLDVDRDGLIAYGHPLRTPADIRLAFRGSLKVGRYDPKLAGHWALTFARAGRQPAIAALQVEYASHIVDAVLNKRLSGLPYHAPGRDGLTATDLAGSDPYAEALVFALWTNNPRHAFQYVRQAATEARAASASDDPRLWAPGAFSEALLQRCRESRFGNWQQRARAIEAREQAVRDGSPEHWTPFERQYLAVLAVRKARRAFELANQRKPDGAKQAQAPGVPTPTKVKRKGKKPPV